MHFPFTISIGSSSILLHSVMEALAFFIGFRYFIFLRKKSGDAYSSANRIYVIIGAIFGALIGSRLVGSLERPYELFLTNDIPAYIYSNKTVLGGFLGGLFGVELMKKMIGEKRASGDLFVYPILLALIIGRIGCFSMGIYEETYGVATHMPWGMDLGDGLYRHPVTIYEIIFLIALWIALKKLSARYILTNGALFKLFMIAYLLFRFFIDFFKPPYFTLFGCTTIQLFSLLGLLYYLPFILQPKKLIQPAYA